MNDEASTDRDASRNRELLEALRARLEKANREQGADAQRQDDMLTIQESVDEEKWEALLPLVIDDVQRGVDVYARYPGLEAQLLADAGLREAFLDALAILEEESE